MIFVAVDLDQSPLNKWPDRPLLVAQLLDLPTVRSDESAAENAAMMHYGYSDLAGQLRSGLGPIHAASSSCRSGSWRA